MATRKEPKKSCVVKEYCNKFKISDPVLCDIMKRLKNAIQMGLSKASHDSSSVKCFLTYIKQLPTGNESGKYLAIDIGGAHFRVLLVTLGPKRTSKIDSRIYAIPDEKIMGSTAEEFFDYLAECVQTFINSMKLGSEEYWLSFCFSFPFHLTSINVGTLTSWSKRFDIPDVVGKDVVHLLQKALDNRNINVKVKALVNDTSACLMASAWKDPNVRIGLIAGTGTNACYLEKTSNIEKLENKSSSHMVISTEWGNFGSDGTLNDITTDVDRELDSIISIRPGNAIFEKMVSTIYLCELIRISIVQCAEKKYLFQGEVTERLKTKGSFLREFIFAIETDEQEMAKTMRILEEFGLTNCSTVDCVNVRYITRSLCRRSAALLSAAVATLVNKISMTPITIAVDGGLYKNHPTYKAMLEEKIRCLANPKIQFKFLMNKEGGGKGAALVAAGLKQGTM